MTTAQHQQVDHIFAQLIEFEDGAERESILGAVGDPEVQEEVRSLLSHAGSPGGAGIATSVGAAMRVAADSAVFEDRTIGPGTRFERYRIERKLGQGGMGDVYAAVRENDFHKQVALKIVRYGLDSNYARGRFQQERQTLAGLEHPYIARLLDGGEASDGCPYLVLELVDGVPINEYCQTCSRNDTLKLFLKVCEAVEYAHRNLIIHRDLKPANILVTADGTPKLLDFGIAKLLDANAETTQTVALALTPQYASPEQIRNQPITTASDVYSLGVVLYLLLTSRKPYEVQTTTPLDLDRVVCVEPPSPAGLGNELDDILMMSLRKEPERRYAGVSQLAEDIERFLDGRPVYASPDTLLYRSRKFIGLHRIGIAAIAAVILVLVAGLASTLYQMHRAEREKREAQQRFQQVRKLANTFLFDFDDAIVNVAGTTRARALVVKTAQEYLNSLSAGSNSDPELQAELAHAYYRVAEVQGAPRKANLGDMAGAEANYRRAVELYEPLVRKDSTHVLDLIDCWTALGILQATAKHFPEAQASLARAAALVPSVRDDGKLQTFASIINVYRAEADTAYFVEDLSLNIRTLREGLAFASNWRKAHPGSGEPDVSFYVGTTHQRLAIGLQSVPLLDQAEAEAIQAVADIGRAHEIDPENARYTRNLIVSQLTLSGIYQSSANAPDLERPAEAAAWGRRALLLLAPQVHAETIDFNSRELYLRGLLRVGYADLLSGKNTGVAETRSALDMWREIENAPAMAGRSGTEVLEDMRDAVTVFSRNGLHAEAGQLARQNVAQRRKLLAGAPASADAQWSLVMDLQAAAEAAAAGGDVSAANRLYDQGDTVAEPLLASADRIVSNAVLAAEFYAAKRRNAERNGNCTEAAELQKKEVHLWEFTSGANPYSAMRLRRAQGRRVCLAKQKRYFFDD